LRTLVILLILANLTLLGYTWLDRSSSGESARLAEQVNPEKIRLLAPREVANLGPAKMAALPDVCAEWGPFGDVDRTRALADLEALALGRLLTQRRVESATSWWVYLPPAPNKAAAETRAALLKAAGIRDFFIVDGGPQRLAISLGVFRTEDAANAYRDDVAAKGFNNVQAGARQQTSMATMLVIRDPREPLISRLRELAPSYPGTDAKVGPCEKSG
jgi:hypothetical protein